MYITKKLWRIIKQNRKDAAAVTGCMILACALYALLMLSWGGLLLALNDQGKYLPWRIGGVVLFTAAWRGSEHFLAYCRINSERKFKCAFCAELFEKLFYLGPGFIDRKQSGELINILWGRTEWVGRYLFYYVPTSLSLLIFSAGCGAVWLPVRPLVSAVILLGGLLVTAAPPLFHKLLKTGSEKEWDDNDAFYSACLDGLKGISTLKAFNANERHRAKVDRMSEENRKSMMSSLIFTTLNSGLIELLISSTEIAADLVGVWSLLRGVIEPYHLILLFMFMQAWTDGAKRILGAWLRGNKGIAAYEGALEILDAECAYSLTDVSGREREAGASPGLDGNVGFENVTFSYSDIRRPAVKDVSFSVERGTQTALVGTSGSGKSTIARLLFGFYKPQLGVIQVGSKTLNAESVRAIQQMTTVIWQDCYIFHMTCLDNIKIARPDAADEEVYAAAKKANIHEMIMGLPDGYNTVIGDGGRTFSGGEKQRVAIARAFLRNTPILILDEATSSLDRKNEAEIQSCIRSLSEGRTVLMIAHRLDTIRSADQICVMEAGEIVERGTHQELMEHGKRYAQLMGAGGAEGGSRGA